MSELLSKHNIDGFINSYYHLGTMHKEGLETDIELNLSKMHKIASKKV